MTMAGRSGECLHSLFHTDHEEPQDRLHDRVGLVHGGVMASPHNTRLAWPLPPTLVSGVPKEQSQSEDILPRSHSPRESPPWCGPG